MTDTPKGCIKADLVYKEVRERKIELTFLPPINKKYKKAPVYFIISGGGWHTERRESMLDFSKKSEDILRKNGYAVVSPDYRVYAEEGITMDHIVSDCFDALKYIAHYADVLEIDPYNITVSGHSAGGHLALMLAYAPQNEFTKDSVLSDSFKVTAAAPMSPATLMYPFENKDTLGFDPCGAYKGIDTLEERKRTSPITYVNENSPVTILFAGTSDRLIFSVASDILYEKLCENKVKAKLVHSFGGGHCFEKIFDGIEPKPTFDDVQDIIVDFVLENTAELSK